MQMNFNLPFFDSTKDKEWWGCTSAYVNIYL